MQLLMLWLLVSEASRINLRRVKLFIFSVSSTSKVDTNIYLSVSFILCILSTGTTNLRLRLVLLHPPWLSSALFAS